MDRLILDLLTYSRISRRELRLEPVSLDKLVREGVGTWMKVGAGPKGGRPTRVFVLNDDIGETASRVNANEA